MKTQDLHQLQGTLRLKILDLYYKVNAGHIGCSLSCIDLIIGSLIHNKTNPNNFILSKGHAAGALYICLNHMGDISDTELGTFYQNGTTLPAHPAAGKFKNIPFATGSLGHGFPIGAGIAKANKLKKDNTPVIVLLSDGETNEGTTWEAAHFARQHQLDNLIIIIDKNKIQGFGYTQDVMGDTSTAAMWKSLGFEVSSVDGHNVDAIVEQISKAKASKNNCPKVIIADTVKGKGVSYMENQVAWHYNPMNDDLYKQAVTEIKSKYKV
ncbi:MAG: transketolase [Bacteroidota bacterium]